MTENTIAQSPIQEKKIKISKKKEKNMGFNVPKKTIENTSNLWGIYIFNIMKEASPKLLTRDDVKIAYNNLIEYLINCPINFKITVSFKRKTNKYSTTHMIISDISNIPLNYDYTQRFKSPCKEIENENLNILKLYNSLYELIKDDVIPFMERQEKEQYKIKMTNCYRKKMDKIEEHLKKLQGSSVMLHKTIEKQKKKLAEYATKIINLDNEAVLSD